MPNEIANFLKPLGLGNMAVMGFFVLSGYVIAEANDIFYKNKTFNFAINRFLRIVPPFFMALLFSVLLHYMIFSYDSGLILSALQRLGDYNDLNIAMSNMFTFENISANGLAIIIWVGLNKIFGLTTDYTFVRYAWAVIVEFEFYFIAAIFYYIHYKYNRKIFEYGLIFLIMALFAYSLVYDFEKLRPFSFAPYFLLGIFLYYGISKKNKLAYYGGGISLLLSSYHLYVYVSKGNISSYYILACLLIYLLFVYAIYSLSQKQFSTKTKKIDKFLGDLSYPIYLNQYAIQILFLSVFIEDRGLLIFLTAVITIVIVSFTLSRVVEPLVKNVRDSVRGVKL